MENAYQLLPLVHEYQMQSLVDECEEAIMKDKTTLSNLKLAELLGLQQLRDHCLKEITTYFPLSDIQEDDIYKGLSVATQTEILCGKIIVMEEAIKKPSGRQQLSQALNQGYQTCPEHVRKTDQYGRISTNVTDCPKCEREILKSFYKTAFPKPVVTKSRSVNKK